MSRDQTKRNCLGIVSQLAEASPTSTPAIWPVLLPSWQRFLWNFPKAGSTEQTRRKMSVRRCGLLCDLYSHSHSTWYLCSSCVYPCTICNWVLFFNCFLRQELLLTWQIVEVLAATPTHGRTPTTERRQLASVLVGCHAHPRMAFTTFPALPSPLLHRVQFVESFVASKFLLCFAVVFWPSTVEFTKFVTFVIFATSSTRVRIEVVVGVGVTVEGEERKGAALSLVRFIYSTDFDNIRVHATILKSQLNEAR